MTIEAGPTRDAVQAAYKASRLAGVTVRELHSTDECVDAEELLAAVWGAPVNAAPFPADLLLALQHSGGCVLGAFAEETMVGLTVGVAGEPGSHRLHSLIAAVVPGHAGRGIGMALKQTQRLWALNRGATTMVWTFDPLVRRNAHFNLNRLGALVTDYRKDFYPPINDAVNKADHTDRFVVAWHLVTPAPLLVVAELGPRVLGHDTDGEPTIVDVADEPVLRAWIPQDVEAMRRSDPAKAKRWRMALREVLDRTWARGYSAAGITGDGCYVLVRGEQVS
ncbi:GNAT family N-acetyltransferase [Lentzea sp. NPDC058450]|uniref:GNAT family N-acetyltransferase n=1 Tax=Lentzea sp. NPDC058450 TaxID=3346505 RepID=UPI00364B6878